ncbi:hypothetical protein FKP32DRAFT_84827 [Trametes sanguinea]|nr:hypothetical protein FKP32DRAFT_84827 [Trametes sanguinea]
MATIHAWLRPDDPGLSSLPQPIAEPRSDCVLFWLFALAGVGKSTVAMTAASDWAKDQVLGAAFFAGRDGGRSDVRCIFRTIAYQLACGFPVFRAALTEILEQDPDLYASTPERQLKRLIADPVQAVKDHPDFPRRLAIVIDALDECTDRAAVSTIVKSIALHHALLGPLRILLTSRPTEQITRGFLQDSLDKNTQRFDLTDVPDTLTRRDISSFVRSRFKEIRTHWPGIHFDWPSQPQVDKLLDLAGSLFIYASTAMLFVENDNARDPEGRLTQLLESGNAASISPLDALYEGVLTKAAEQLPERLRKNLQQMLGMLVLAEERLTPATLATLLNLPSIDVRRTLPVLHAVMTVPAADDESTPIRLIHLSFTNFLVDGTRCTNKEFLVDSPVHHALIALRCLKVMQESLKHNICEIPSKHDHLLNNDIPGLAARISRYLLPALQYACRYFLHHLGQADIGEELLSALKEFCNTHLLHWLEALSLLGCVDGAAEALRCTQLYLEQRCPEATEVLSLLYDCERMVRAFYPAISASFWQVYRTAIPFSPTDSPLRRLHQEDTSHVMEVRMGLEKAWSSTLASRVTGAASVTALAFSPDGTRVACGAEDGSIQLLNTHTTAQLQVLKGHTNWVRCVSFSPTGKEMLSGSHDQTTRLWDVATGACLHAWEGDSGLVFSVAWSLDGALVASGAGDGSVSVWMVATPEKTVVFRHNNSVCDVSFAADRTLVSGSDDRTCKVWDTKQLDWDATDHTPSQVLEHDQGVTAVAVSPDSCVVACGLFKAEIVLWRKSDGQRLRSLPGESCVISLAFYPDSRLAVAYMTAPFILWDVSTATPLETVDNAYADAAAFSPDGVHVAADATCGTVQIRRWSGNASRESKSKKGTASSPAIRAKRWLHSHLPAFCSSQVLEAKADVNHVTGVKAVAISPTGSLILAVFDDEWRLWDVANGRWIRTGKHAGSDFPIVAWSPSGNLFACTNTDHVIRVWETQTGELVGSLAEHSTDVIAVVLTADDDHLLSASRYGSIRRWNLVRQSRQETSCDVLFQSYDDDIDALALSADGQWMLSGSHQFISPPDTSSSDLLAKPSRQPVHFYNLYCALRLHDATGRVLWIEHHPSNITSLTFSEDSTRALVGNDKGEVFLYDLTQLIPPDKSALRSPPPLAVPEHRFGSGSTHPAFYVSFAPGDQGIITERSYIPMTSDLQPLARGAVNASLPPAYFVDDDGWLWRANPTLGPHRICWLSLSFRPIGTAKGTRTWRSQHGHDIVYQSPGGCLVVIHTS